MSACLLDCLREAQLEKYFPSFVQHGVTNCEHLVALSMPDYPRYGVTTMENRVKLFKLIQIVKSVQAEGVFCKHDSYGGVIRRDTHQQGPASRMAAGQEGGMVRRDEAVMRRKLVTVSAGQTAKVVSEKPRMGTRGLFQQDSMEKAALSKPKAHAEVRDERKVNCRKSLFKGKPAVEFKEGSDEPFFHCRKALNFSDSSLLSDEEEEIVPVKLAKSTEGSLNSGSNNTSLENVKSKPLQTNVLVSGSALNLPRSASKLTDLCRTGASESKLVNQIKNNVPGLKPQNQPQTDTGIAVTNAHLYSVFQAQKPQSDISHALGKNQTEKNPTGGKIVKQHIAMHSQHSEQNVPQNPRGTAQITARQAELASAQASLRNIIVMDRKPNMITKLTPEPKRFFVEFEAPTREVTSTHPVSPAVRMEAEPVKDTPNPGQQVKDVPSAGQQLSPIELTGLEGMPPHSLSQSATSTQPWHSTMIQQQPPQQAPASSTINRNNMQHPDKHVKQQNVKTEGKDHAYFPAADSPQTVGRVIHRERVYHNSGYNYGLPQQATGSGHKNSRSPVKGGIGDRITVCVRKRPLNQREAKRGELDVVKITGPNMAVVEEGRMALDLSKFIHEHVFMFDETFNERATNQDVYLRAVKPLVTCVFDRGAATCFAFGQTGAGKTHTLIGNKNVPGLYQLAAADILNMLHSPQLADLKLRLWASYYEIYNSQLYDLLNKRKRLYVRENGKHKVCIAGLMETQVANIKALTEVVRYGSGCRSTGSTGVNPHSSRSHAILQLEVRDSREFKVGRLSFIDLAGSERASDACNLDNKQSRMEGAEINQSLLALKECIRSLDQASGHTPYRQSKLTHILRDSFTGNCRTVMIANVAPTQAACDNTLNTLRYADRVKELRRESPLRPRQINGSHVSDHEPSPKKITPRGALFHPSNIQYSSTPKTKATPNRSNTNLLDISNALHEANESPIRGHQVQKSRSNSRPTSEDEDGVVPRHGNVYSSERVVSSVEISEGGTILEPATMTGKHTRTDSTKSDTQVVLGRPSAVIADQASKDHNNKVLTNTAKMYKSEGTLLDKNTQDKPTTQPLKPIRRSHSAHGVGKAFSPRGASQGESGGPSAHSTPKSSRNSSSRSDEDIIREHQEIMSHLDVVLDKAKSVMRRSSLSDTSDSGDGGSSAVDAGPPSHKDHSSESNNTSQSSSKQNHSGPGSIYSPAAKKSSIESAREILRELRASGQPLQAKPRSERFAAKAAAIKYKHASKSQPDVRQSGAEFIPIQRTQSQKGVVGAAGSTEETVTATMEQSPPQTYRKYSMPDQDRSPRLNRPEHGGGLLSMLRAREQQQASVREEAQGTAMSSQNRRWHLSDPFPIGMRQRIGRGRPQGGNQSTILPQTSESNLGDVASSKPQKAAVDQDKSNPHHILKSLAEIQNARKLLGQNLGKQDQAPVPVDAAKPQDTTSKGAASLRPFPALLESPSNAKRSQEQRGENSGRDIPILLLQPKDMEALKTQAITSLSVAGSGAPRSHNVAIPVTVENRAEPHVAQSHSSTATAPLPEARPAGSNTQTWAEVLRSPSPSSRQEEAQDRPCSKSPVQQSNVFTKPSAEEIESATSTASQDPGIVSDSGLGSITSTRREERLRREELSEEHSEASTLDGVANLPVTVDTAPVKTAVEPANVEHGVPKHGTSKQAKEVSVASPVAEECCLSDTQPVNNGVPLNVQQQQQQQQQQTEIHTAQPDVPTRPSQLAGPVGSLTIHRDSAFTKVAVSSQEVDQIRQTALSQGYVLSDTSGSQPPSADTSSSAFPTHGEYKRSPVRSEKPKMADSADSIFSPIIAFPVTPRDNPKITVPCATKLELSDPDNHSGDVSLEQPPAPPSENPALNATSSSASFTNSQVNVNKTLEKQLRKLKGQLQEVILPTGECEVSQAMPPPVENGVNQESVLPPVECSGSARRSVASSVSSEESSSSGSLDSGSSALFRAQSLLLAAHEEQLSQTTTQCKQEMKLLMDLRQGQKDFDEYLCDLQDLLASKLQSVATLRAQIHDFCNISQA